MYEQEVHPLLASQLFFGFTCVVAYMYCVISFGMYAYSPDRHSHTPKTPSHTPFCIPDELQYPAAEITHTIGILSFHLQSFLLGGHLAMKAVYRTPNQKWTLTPLATTQYTRVQEALAAIQPLHTVLHTPTCTHPLV